MDDCEYMLDAEAWLDGESGELAGEISRHIAICPRCKAHVEAVRRLDFAAREAGKTIGANASLAEKLDNLDASAPASPVSFMSRRGLLAGWATTASVAALGSVFLLTRGDRARDLPMAVLGDFATHLEADRKLDLAESDPERVAGWFAPKLPFDLPPLPSDFGLQLLGGRLCWLLDRRIAAFNFSHEGRALGLYLTLADGLTGPDGKELPGPAPASATTVSGFGLTAAYWKRRELAHVVVGPFPSQEIVRLAARIAEPGSLGNPGNSA